MRKFRIRCRKDDSKYLCPPEGGDIVKGSVRLVSKSESGIFDDKFVKNKWSEERRYSMDVFNKYFIKEFIPDPDVMYTPSQRKINI